MKNRRFVITIQEVGIESEVKKDWVRKWSDASYETLFKKQGVQIRPDDLPSQYYYQKTTEEREKFREIFSQTVDAIDLPKVIAAVNGMRNV